MSGPRASFSAPTGLYREPSHQQVGEGVALEPITSHHAHFELPVEEEEFDDDGSDQHHHTRRPVVDIEHVPVDDDPRDWSPRKKNFVLALMTAAVLGPMISPSIYNPVLDEVKSDLHSSETQIGLSLSIYILIQGGVPVIWASVAEIIGRKPIYLLSFILYTIGSVVGSRANSMSVLIGMRCLQAIGSSAVLTCGAGSLADMYEVEERGRKLGIYYGMPMLGPTLGPLVGGALGNAYGWRATLYFLAVFAFIMTVAFLFFPDTWRKERSRAYQKAIEHSIRRSLRADAAAERKRQRKLARGLASGATTPRTIAGTPWSGAQTPVTRPSSVHGGQEGSVGVGDVEQGQAQGEKKKRQWLPKSIRKHITFLANPDDPDEIHPSLRDVNPLPMIVSICQSPTNAVVLTCSGVLFAAQYTTTYTASVTFSKAPYNYSPLLVGVVLLSFGGGNIAGSILGGRFSDWLLARLKAANGGVATPGMRLKSAMPGMPLMVGSYLIYAWTANARTNVAGPVVGLFLAGFSLIFVYTNTLAYLVDSNPGRAASAVSCNSFARGALACVMSQVAQPILNGIGDGGLYTLVAGLMALSSVGLVVVAYKDIEWRQAHEKRKQDKHRRREEHESVAASALASGAQTPAPEDGQDVVSEKGLKRTCKEAR